MVPVAVSHVLPGRSRLALPFAHNLAIFLARTRGHSRLHRMPKLPLSGCTLLMPVLLRDMLSVSPLAASSMVQLVLFLSRTKSQTFDSFAHTHSRHLVSSFSLFSHLCPPVKRSQKNHPALPVPIKAPVDSPDKHSHHQKAYFTMWTPDLRRLWRRPEFPKPGQTVHSPDGTFEVEISSTVQAPSRRRAGVYIGQLGSQEIVIKVFAM